MRAIRGPGFGFLTETRISSGLGCPPLCRTAWNAPRIVTPLSPTDWKLIFNGKTISLDPSIGNWGFECQSHYWIRNNRVRWAAQWSPEEIAAGRAHERFAKERYFDAAGAATEDAPKDTPVTVETAKEKPGIWQKVKKWWHGS